MTPGTREALWASGKGICLAQGNRRLVLIPFPGDSEARASHNLNKLRPPGLGIIGNMEDLGNSPNVKSYLVMLTGDYIHG